MKNVMKKKNNVASFKVKMKSCWDAATAIKSSDESFPWQHTCSSDSSNSPLINLSKRASRSSLRGFLAAGSRPEITASTTSATLSFSWILKINAIVSLSQRYSRPTPTHCSICVSFLLFVHVNYPSLHYATQFCCSYFKSNTKLYFVSVLLNTFKIFKILELKFYLISLR